MCTEAELDVVAVTETWLDDSIMDSETLLCGSGLSMLQVDRNWCGGVCDTGHCASYCEI